MTQNGSKRGSRRHLGARSGQILNGRAEKHTFPLLPARPRSRASGPERDGGSRASGPELDRPRVPDQRTRAGPDPPVPGQRTRAGPPPSPGPGPVGQGGAGGAPVPGQRTRAGPVGGAPGSVPVAQSGGLVPDQRTKAGPPHPRSRAGDQRGDTPPNVTKTISGNTEQQRESRAEALDDIQRAKSPGRGRRGQSQAELLRLRSSWPERSGAERS